MTLTGIVEISSFDERKIVLMTEQDQLTVTGNLLHICKFNTQTGEVRLEGIIDSLVYSDKKKKDRIRLWDKIFRYKVSQTQSAEESESYDVGGPLQKALLPG